jgi:hypothetical protein
MAFTWSTGGKRITLDKMDDEHLFNTTKMISRKIYKLEQAKRKMHEELQRRKEERLKNKQLEK